MKNHKATVLIVEDDGMLRDILVSKFKNGFKVISAEDGEKGLKAISKNKPDIMLLDLMLPKIDGFQVLESVRKNEDKVIAAMPVVVLSNLWSNKDILRIQALKIEEYYVKSGTDLGIVYKRVEDIISKMSDR